MKALKDQRNNVPVFNRALGRIFHFSSLNSIKFRSHCLVPWRFPRLARHWLHDITSANVLEAKDHQLKLPIDTITTKERYLRSNKLCITEIMSNWLISGNKNSFQVVHRSSIDIAEADSRLKPQGCVTHQIVHSGCAALATGSSCMHS